MPAIRRKVKINAQQELTDNRVQTERGRSSRSDRNCPQPAKFGTPFRERRPTLVPYPTPGASSPGLLPTSSQLSDDDLSIFTRLSSHSRKQKPGHIPRPPNAFMLFRSHLWSEEKKRPTAERDHRQISRMAGKIWNDLSEKDRAPFKQQAALEKRRHAELYPGYKYTPVSKQTKREPVKKYSKATHGGRVGRAPSHRKDGDVEDQSWGSDDDSDNVSEDDFSPFPTPPRRLRRSQHQSRRDRGEFTDDERPLPHALPNDMLKMEPMTPELTPSPAPARQTPEFVPDADIPRLSLPEPFMPVTPTAKVVDFLPAGEPPVFGEWPDDPPAVLDIVLQPDGQGYLKSSSPALYMPVTTPSYSQLEPFAAAVEDASAGLSPTVDLDLDCRSPLTPSQIFLEICHSVDSFGPDDASHFDQWINEDLA